MFMTMWDAAATGSNIRLQKLLQLEDAAFAKDPKNNVPALHKQTFWLKNTCLHLAAKNAQLDCVKLLMTLANRDKKRYGKLGEVKNG